MKFLLDTNIIIETLKGNLNTISFLNNYSKNYIPATTPTSITEIFAGIKPKETKAVNNFLESLQIIDYNFTIAITAGLLINKLKKQGITLSLADSQIAATAITYNFPLATKNIKGFQQIPNIILLNY